MRLTTINVEKFQHDGLVVDKGWTLFNYAKAEPKAQQSFRDHVGRFVRIHPDDVGELVKLGLALDENRLVEVKPDAKPDTKSDPVESKGKGDNGSAKGKDAPK